MGLPSADSIWSKNEITNPLIVTDSGSVDLPFIDNLVEILKKSKINSGIYSKISPNPRDDEIASGKKLFNDNNHDAIIAIGGGSAMDGGKAICLTANTYYNSYNSWNRC